MAEQDPSPNLTDLLRLSAAVAVGAAALIHFLEAPSHFQDPVHGYFLLGVGIAQGFAALLLLQRRPRWIYAAVAAGDAVVAGVWAVSRTIGVPVGHHEGLPEPVGFPDGAATTFEIVVAVFLVAVVVGPRSAGALTRRSLFAVLALVVAASSATVITAEMIPRPGIEDCVEAETGWEVARCLLPHFRQEARAGGSAAVLSELDGAYRRGDLDDCHLPAHHLGHITYEVEGDLSFLAAEGSEECFDGMIHGGVELAVEDGAVWGGEAWEVGEVCAPLRALGVYRACVHGLGHGLMHLTEGDVGGSIAGCRTLTTPTEPGICIGGVLMENVMQHLTLPPGRYRDQARSACEDLDLSKGDLRTCYGQIGEISMFYFRHDLSEVRTICGSLRASGAERACVAGAEAQLRLVEASRRR